jgi:predicted RNA-binding Zn-ribbon protein involved in translation (DUF1610 family)
MTIHTNPIIGAGLLGEVMPQVLVCRRRNSSAAASLEAETGRGYIRSMAETFKCPHCGALYEIIAHERTVSDDKDVADCQVCGRRMDATNGSRILRYELVRMPDGTNV